MATKKPRNTRAPNPSPETVKPQTGTSLANDEVATPTGMSVPVGTNTSESGGGAAGQEPSSSEIPQGNDGVKDAVTDPDPKVSASASGISDASTEDQLQRIAAIVRETATATAGDAPSAFEEFEARYPQVTALYAGWPAPDEEFGISITSKRDGFRRGDLAHGKEAVVYGAGDISPDQLEAILSEPMLTVELV